MCSFMPRTHKRCHGHTSVSRVPPALIIVKRSSQSEWWPTLSLERLLKPTDLRRRHSLLHLGSFQCDFKISLGLVTGFKYSQAYGHQHDKGELTTQCKSLNWLMRDMEPGVVISAKGEREIYVVECYTVEIWTGLDPDLPPKGDNDSEVLLLLSAGGWRNSFSDVSTAQHV